MSLVIITLNIGGKIYQVSKELLNKYPKTMLCMVASEIETNNHDEPIFIDGNSERFPYVLDFMRFQKVELPFHIGKESFLRDLDYYGFGNKSLEYIENLLQKNKRQERMGLLALRCMAEIIALAKKGQVDDDAPPFVMTGLHDMNVINSELGLHIIFDSSHEEHVHYCYTLTSILSEHKIHTLWDYLGNAPSELPFLRPVIRDGIRVVLIGTY